MAAMTKQYTKIATLVVPDRAEQARRKYNLAIAQGYVLRGAEHGRPDLALFPPEGSDAEPFTANSATRRALLIMFDKYAEAKTSSTLTAEKSAINLARMHFTRLGEAVDTRGAKPDSFAAGFGLAMVYFHKCVLWAKHQENPKASA